MASYLNQFLHTQNLSKAIVISAHLCAEHLLFRSLFAVLPKAEMLERERSPSFPLLVSLCEAHGVISPQIGESLRILNGIRNRCAHRGSYNPDIQDWKKLRHCLESVAVTQPELELKIATNDPDTDELEALISVLEIRARAVGATDLEVG